MVTFDDDVQKMHAMQASTKQDEAHAKLASMRDRGGAAWPDLKVGGETAGTPSRLPL